MNEIELLKYMSFTDDKVMFDKCFYQEVMMPCFSNSITYKNIVKELEKENQQLKEDILFCLKSIKQEMEMSTDSRTKQEMLSCYQILSKWSDK